MIKYQFFAALLTTAATASAQVASTPPGGTAPKVRPVVEKGRTIPYDPATVGTVTRMPGTAETADFKPIVNPPVGGGGTTIHTGGANTTEGGTPIGGSLGGLGGGTGGGDGGPKGMIAGNAPALAPGHVMAGPGGGPRVATPAPGMPHLAQPSLKAALVQGGHFTNFLSLLAQSGLAGEGPPPNKGATGPMTWLVPTDAAFAALGNKRLAQLRGDAIRLRTFILAHTIPSSLKVADLFDPVPNSKKSFTNRQGWVLGFSCDGRAHAGPHRPFIDGKARIGLFQDVVTSAGIVHEIDAVLPMR